MTTTVSHELDYTPKILNGPHYKYTRLFPTNSSTDVALNVASTTETQFEVPTKVFNSSKCYLKGNMTLTSGGGADIKKLVHKYGFVMIDSISISTRAGVFISNIRHVGRYSRAILQATTSKEKYLSKPPLVLTNALGATTYPGEMIAPANQISAIGALVQSGDFAGADGAYVANATTPLFLDTVGSATTATATVCYKFKIPFSDLKSSFFALNKDVWFNEVLLVTINWNPFVRLGGTIDHADYFSWATTRGALTAGAISDLGLYMAVEQNQAISNEVMAKVLNGGINLVIPYVNSFKLTAGTGASGSISQRINRANGRTLCRVVTSVAGTVEASSTADWNTNNQAGTKTASFYTTMDSVKQQEANLTPATHTDFLALADLLEGSAYYTGLSWQVNPVWVDNFHGNKSIHWCDGEHDDDFKQGGIPLDSEITWGYVADTKEAVALNYYIFAITQKLLTITSMGVECN